ncbi:MAG: hypothetical protein CMP86_11450 [Gammaproteobacteria bacterium]|nr:hypothetical protein [Gammaproteobacteria bacterium]
MIADILNNSIRPNPMQNAAAQRIIEPLQEDVTETKKSPELHEVEETLSEFERARRCSKTWSMPQD